MASSVYTVEQVELQSGTTLELKPLPIKTLRKFMAQLAKLSEVKTEDDGIDAMLALAALCIQAQVPELVKDQDALEEALDMPTVYKIIEVCGGVKLNDPNLLAAAQRMATAEVGTN